MTPSEPLDKELGPPAAGLAELARHTLGAVSEAQRAQGLVALRSAMSARRRARAARRRYALVAAGFLCTAAAVPATMMVLHRGHPAAISFRVEGADVRPGGYVEAAPATRPVLRFSDGSEVSLAERARVHVHAINEHGARVTLDEGQAHVYVVHAAETHWVFDAGPFVVAVTGTAFGLAWSADERRLDVRLENGSVTVSGPVSDAPLALRAGQWLTVRANDVLIRALGADGGLPNGLGEEMPEAPPPTGESGPVSAEQPGAISLDGPNASPAQGRERHAVTGGDRGAEHANRGRQAWAAELADGRFAAIVDDATRMGLDAAFSTSSSDELAALADAARYTRSRDVARGALMAQRRRFPGTDEAHVAAFSLGRLSESEDDPRAALSWFEDYLSEAAGGTFASEALGRKMTIVERLDGKDAARPLAQMYLRRFSNGTYADAARALTLRP